VVIGSGIGDSVIEELGRHGARHVLLADDTRLEPFTVESYAWVLARAIEARKPWAVLLPATSFGRDLAARVAARLALGLTADCVGFEMPDDWTLLGIKPSFGGQVLALIDSTERPYMATVRPGAVPIYLAHEESRPEVIRLDTEGLPKSRVKVLSVQRGGEEGLALDDARLVVCVGMGIGGPEALPEVYRLASRLGTWMGLKPEEVAVGGTRKVVDEGWLPRHQQIGITGRSVSPDLYIGLGLQGNFNHTAGIMRAATIVAVNNDPGAPIFDMSDIGVVADWREFADAFVEALADEDTVIATATD
jgi:electron transfer flavoprotein alpha subunit